MQEMVFSPAAVLTTNNPKQKMGLQSTWDSRVPPNISTYLTNVHQKSYAMQWKHGYDWMHRVWIKNIAKRNMAVTHPIGTQPETSETHSLSFPLIIVFELILCFRSLRTFTLHCVMAVGFCITTPEKFNFSHWYKNCYTYLLINIERAVSNIRVVLCCCGIIDVDLGFRSYERNFGTRLLQN